MNIGCNFSRVYESQFISLYVQHWFIMFDILLFRFVFITRCFSQVSNKGRRWIINSFCTSGFMLNCISFCQVKFNLIKNIQSSIVLCHAYQVNSHLNDSLSQVLLDKYKAADERLYILNELTTPCVYCVSVICLP